MRKVWTFSVTSPDTRDRLCYHSHESWKTATWWCQVYTLWSIFSFFFKVLIICDCTDSQTLLQHEIGFIACCVLCLSLSIEDLNYLVILPLVIFFIDLTLKHWFKNSILVPVHYDSAYSIFNEDFRELPGTFNADRLDRDIRAGQFWACYASYSHDNVVKKPEVCLPGVL